MNFNDCFKNLKNIFMRRDISGVDDFLAFQFNIIGEGEGVFYAELKDGVLSIEPYEYIDKQADFTATYKVFKDIASGRLNPIKAYLTKQLIVKGELDKAMKLQKLI